MTHFAGWDWEAALCGCSADGINACDVLDVRWDQGSNIEVFFTCSDIIEYRSHGELRQLDNDSCCAGFAGQM